VFHSHPDSAFERTDDRACRPFQTGATSCERAVPIDPIFSDQPTRLARQLVEARSRRRVFFKSSLFSDPAWDILLELYAAQGEGRRLSVSATGVTSRIPATTVLRWLAALEQENLISREADPLDGRRVFVSLTDSGTDGLRAYFESASLTATRMDVASGAGRGHFKSS
jgi:DNA-binding MarR family transcriptional regulator